MNQGPSPTKRKDVPNEREQEILWHLYNNPHIKDIEISNAMRLTESQIRYAREAMIQRGWIKNSPRVDLSMLGFPERYRVDILIDSRELKVAAAGPGGQSTIGGQRGLALHIVNTLAKENRFKSTILIEDILILLGGSADLTAIVRATNNSAMLEFVTEGLRMCRGVARTVSCLEQRSYLNGTL